MSKIMCNTHNPTLKFKPCNTNDIHLEQMKRMSEGRRVCVSTRWYRVSILRNISIISVSDISISICIEKIDIYDNTTLHLVYYFRRLFKRLKNVYVKYKIHPAKVASRSDCVTLHC